MKRSIIKWLGVLLMVLSAGTANAKGGETAKGAVTISKENALLDASNSDLWSYAGNHGSFGYENKTSSVGYVKNPSTATAKFTVADAGAYEYTQAFAPNGGGKIVVTLTDDATGNVELSATADIVKGMPDLTAAGYLTVGAKTLTLELTGDHTSWICNYYSPSLTWKSDKFIAVSDVTAEGCEAVEMDGYDWAFNIPLTYSADNVALRIKSEGTLTVKAGDAVIEGMDGIYNIPTPAPNAATELLLTVNDTEGNYCPKSEYRVRLYHVGGIIMTGMTVGGLTVSDEALAALNEDAANATIDGYIFTTQPEIEATFIDGTTAKATLQTSGTTSVYTLKATSGTLIKDYTITVGGIHLYANAETDKTDKITFDGACVSGGLWNNGKYTVNSTDGWGGTQFKFKSNSTVTLTVPANVKVKQLRLAQLFDNYSDGKIKAVTTTGTVYLPSASSFKKGRENAYDLIINIDGHKAGTPINIDIENGGQPVMWFEFVYEEVALSTPVVCNSMSRTPNTEVCNQNHYVVSFSFDRPVENATATLYKMVSSARQKVEDLSAEGGSSVIRYALWDLDYNTEYELVLAKDAVGDKSGNKNEEEIVYPLSIGNKAEVATVDGERFIVVSNVAELRAAVAGLSASNKNADSKNTTIYIKNGDYNLGDEVNGGATDVCLGINKVYNVSVIGESQEGVIIHGTRTGISNPIFSTRYSTNVYMENFTLRNDFDFGKERKGVAVAHYGGNLDIMKNVTLQSQQDTQVTGERGYYYNCTIHGSVDYICGGGSHVYESCTLVQTNPGAITAPSTSESLKYGYVFLNCIIDGVDGFNLGRPWQNAPRCAWINTTIKSKGDEAGWSGMGNLPTYFYEYNSMDVDGNPIDLSKRKNSPSSTNTYNPVLTADEAAHYNIHEVLGATDSWLPTELTAECEAPVVSETDGKLTWSTVAGASGYIIFADNAYKTMTADASYAIVSTDKAVKYYVVAFNANGACGKPSNTVDYTETAIQGIKDNGAAVELSRNQPVYNLAGQRVSTSVKGILIQNGKKFMSK